MECVDSLFPVDSFVKRKNTNCHVQCSCLLIMEYKWYTNRDIPFRDRQDGCRGACKPPRCTNAPRNHNVHGTELIDTYRKSQFYLNELSSRKLHSDLSQNYACSAFKPTLSVCLATSPVWLRGSI